ncbi:hypothetical protein ACFQ9X_48385 [Catenulispora yoronensis]
MRRGGSGGSGGSDGSGGSGKNGAPTAASSGKSASGSAPTSGATTTNAAASDGTIAVPSGIDADTKKSYDLENTIAICMRGKGFAYTAWFPKPSSSNSPIDDDADYDASKAVLAKYGFGAYAQWVYPNDPNVPGHYEMQVSPNSAVRDALDAAQQRLWDKTLVGDIAVAKQTGSKFTPDSCTGQAFAKVYPNQPDEAQASSEGKAAAARAAQDRQNLNGDPALVALAQTYANCLRGKGITVSSTQVTEIRNAVRFQYVSQAAQRAQAAGGHLDVATATPLLTTEIRDSLADLDCGRAFRAAYLPKLKQAPDAEGVG